MNPPDNDPNSISRRDFVRTAALAATAVSSGLGLASSARGQAAGAPAAENRAYDIAGGETLSYRRMVERIFAAEGRRPVTPTVPLAAFRLVEPGDDVEERGLAGAIGAYEAVDAAIGDAQADVVQGLEAAEALLDVFQF